MPEKSMPEKHNNKKKLTYVCLMLDPRILQKFQIKFSSKSRTSPLENCVAFACLKGTLPRLGFLVQIMVL